MFREIFIQAIPTNILLLKPIKYEKQENSPRFVTKNKQINSEKNSLNREGFCGLRETCSLMENIRQNII